MKTWITKKLRQGIPFVFRVTLIHGIVKMCRVKFQLWWLKLNNCQAKLPICVYCKHRMSLDDMQHNIVIALRNKKARNLSRESSLCSLCRASCIKNVWHVRSIKVSGEAWEHVSGGRRNKANIQILNIGFAQMHLTACMTLWHSNVNNVSNTMRCYSNIHLFLWHATSLERNKTLQHIECTYTVQEFLPGYFDLMSNKNKAHDTFSVSSTCRNWLAKGKTTNRCVSGFISFVLFENWMRRPIDWCLPFSLHFQVCSCAHNCVCSQTMPLLGVSQSIRVMVAFSSPSSICARVRAINVRRCLTMVTLHE